MFIEGSKEGFLNQNVTEGFLCPELVEGSFPQWEAEAFRDRRSNLRGYSYLLLSVGVLYKQNNGQLLVNHMHPTRGMNRMVHTRGGRRPKANKVIKKLGLNETPLEKTQGAFFALFMV